MHDSWQNLIAGKFSFAELKPKIAESKKIEELSKNFILVNLEVGVRPIYEAINNNYSIWYILTDLAYIYSCSP